MKRIMAVAVFASLLLIAAFPASSAARPGVDVRVNIGGIGPVSRFYIDLGNYYHIPYREVYAMHQAGICDDDIPVLLYIHARAHYPLRELWGLRLRGVGFDRIFARAGVPYRGFESERLTWHNGIPRQALIRNERRDGAMRHDDRRFSVNGARPGGDHRDLRKPGENR
ncbi:MAG TPA: hypothetical protein VMW43_10280 [Bacteroidota bacterium]|nr:hypothetical protein [Bacteroidota bacterium]